MDVLGTKYVVERRLGGGGMAEVFLGRTVGAEGFSRTVAIKRVIAGHAENPHFVSMFVSEAQISARLQHPNIVSVLDFDRDDEGRPYLVMEHVEGVDLQELIDTGPLPVAAIVHVVAEVLRGLGYAHQLPVQVDGVRGVVHRDVSPHNVLMSWEGAVKVSDFGIAKARAASDVTASEMLKGKPAYMSPEQANGDALDGRSDLFAVGIMLWQMLSGRTLFAGQTTQETLARLLFAPILSPKELRDDVSDDLANITMKLLARDRDERYSTANAAVADLLALPCYPRSGTSLLVALLEERFVGSAPARPADDASKPTAVPSVGKAKSVSRLPGPLDGAPTKLEPARASRRWTIAAAAALAAVGAGLAVYLIAGRDKPPPSTIANQSASTSQGSALPTAPNSSTIAPDTVSAVSDANIAPIVADAHVAAIVDDASAGPAPRDAAIAGAAGAAGSAGTAGTAGARKQRDAGATPSDASVATVAPPDNPAIDKPAIEKPAIEKPSDQSPGAEQPAGNKSGETATGVELLKKIALKGPYTMDAGPAASFDPHAFYARARAFAQKAFGTKIRAENIHYYGLQANGRIDTRTGDATFSFAATQPEYEYCIITFIVKHGRATVTLARSENNVICRPGSDRAPRCTGKQLYERALAGGMPAEGGPMIAFTQGRSNWNISRSGHSDVLSNDCQ